MYVGLHIIDLHPGPLAGPGAWLELGMLEGVLPGIEL